MPGELNMIRKSTLLPGALVVLTLMGPGCRSPKRSAYEAVAEQMNPLLLRVLPTATAMNAIVGDSTDATLGVIDVCTTADDALWILRDVREDDERIRRDYDSGKPRTSEIARRMLDSRAVNCPTPTAEPHRLTMCRNFCREMWGELALAAERLRAAASKEGVVIVLLSAR